MQKVYIVEDQVVMRGFIKRLLDGYPGLELAGESGDGHHAYEQCLEVKPDMIILDVMLPGLNGAEVLTRLKKQLPKVRVLGFSAFPTKHILKQMVEAGADGLVRKSESLDTLEKAIEQVSSGSTFFSPDVVEMLRDIMLHPEQVSSITELSSRERQVLQLIAESHSNKDIASVLGISVKTAETHRNNIMRKLNIHDAVGLTRYAIANGLVSGDQSPL